MKSKLLSLILLITCAMCVASIGCAGLQTQHQKIAAACEGIASGLDAATAAKQGGRITGAQLQAVVDIAKPTTRFCQPEPAESLNPSDYAALLSAAARVAASPGATP